MYAKYDYRFGLTSNIVFLKISSRDGDKGKTRWDDQFSVIMERVRKTKESCKKVVCEEEKEEFLRMIPVMKAIASLQGGCLEIRLNETYGTFSLTGEQLLICRHMGGNSDWVDTRFLEYIKDQMTFILPDNNGIRIEIIHSFLREETV